MKAIWNWKMDAYLFAPDNFGVEPPHSITSTSVENYVEELLVKGIIRIMKLSKDLKK
jgi:hypothetical protein